MLRFNKLALIAIAVVVAIIVFLVGLSMILTRDSGSKVENYDPDGVCAAQTPECGFCPGNVRGDKCYKAKD